MIHKTSETHQQFKGITVDGWKNPANQLRLVVTSHYSTTILNVPGGGRQISINRSFGICLVISVTIPASLGHRCSRCSTSRKSFRHGWSWRGRSCLLLGDRNLLSAVPVSIPIRVVPLNATYHNIVSSNTIIYQGVSEPTWPKTPYRSVLSRIFMKHVHRGHAMFLFKVFFEGAHHLHLKFLTWYQYVHINVYVYIKTYTYN